jgi:hypothetical protein
MKRVLIVLGMLAIGLVAAGPVAADDRGGQAPAAQTPPPPPPPPAVKVGEPMPEFSLNYFEPAPDGRPQQKTAKLSDFKGKQVVVLAFFPAAFSPG